MDVILETSHDHVDTNHDDIDCGEDVDSVSLRSKLWDFEDILTNDGSTGIAVINSQRSQEIQLDEHKMLIIYGQTRKSLMPFQEIFEGVNIKNIPDLSFVSEYFHIHQSTDEYREKFHELRRSFGDI